MTRPPKTALVANGVTPPTPQPAPENAALKPPLSGAPDPILAMIERAARDPAVDLAKLQGLMAMKKDIEAERASIAFAEAFVELQPTLPVIDRKGRISIFSKADRDKPGGVPEGAQPIQKTPYATLDDILEALRAPLAQYGFSIRFEHSTTSDNRLITTAVLRHRQGHEEKATTPPLQHDTTGSKNNVQAVGSSLTYGRRYALMAVLPIVSHAPQDGDDDGRAAGSAPADIDAIAQVQQLLTETGSDLAKFLEWVGAAEVAALTAAQAKRGAAFLEEKKRRAKATAEKAANETRPQA